MVPLCADGDAARFRAVRAQLSSPVFPRETLRLDAWRLADGDMAFRARVLEGDVIVLSHGRAQVLRDGLRRGADTR